MVLIRRAVPALSGLHGRRVHLPGGAGGAEGLAGYCGEYVAQGDHGAVHGAGLLAAGERRQLHVHARDSARALSGLRGRNLGSVSELAEWALMGVRNVIGRRDKRSLPMQDFEAAKQDRQKSKIADQQLPHTAIFENIGHTIEGDALLILLRLRKVEVQRDRPKDTVVLQIKFDYISANFVKCNTFLVCSIVSYLLYPLIG
mmetsp:Transcript_42320/g.99277  ORF Transcript_42320/g.99277 Transcript_42320/m.99277 type:complete len:201 (-) Transcript_42320:87-689(-)